MKILQLFVHLWCVPGQEEEFRAYENRALKIFERYGGKVLERLRPDAALSTAPVPHEIHRLQIASLEAWQQFRDDAVLQSLAPQRAVCIEKTQVFLCLTPHSNP